jgi:hypothetical protein
MAYEFHRVGRQKLKYNSANSGNPLSMQLFTNGAKATITAGATNNVALYDPDGTVIGATNSPTLSGSIAKWTQDTTTVATWPIADGYKAVWTLLDADAAIIDGIVQIFDVARYLFTLDFGVDQLIDADDGLRGMSWDGAETFAGPITSVRDWVEARLESKVMGNQRLREQMILDSSRISTATILKVLSRIWRVKRNDELADHYEKEFESIWEAVMSTQPIDDDQAGTEPTETDNKIQEVRLVT